MKNIIRVFVLFLIGTALTAAVLAAPSAVTVADTSAEYVQPVNTFNSEAQLMGDGTEAFPYLISTASEYNTYAGYIKSNNSSYAGKYYKLSGNIDFEGTEMVPFGTLTAKFKGTLDGNGYALLNVKIPDTVYSGAVGYMTQGSIKNLRVVYEDAEDYESYSNIKYFGGIVGYSLVNSSNTISISGCEVSGNAMIESSDAAYMGGIIGYVKCESGNAKIMDCVSEMSFDVKTEKNSYLAGFAAYVFGGSSNDYVFKNCISYGNVNLDVNFDEATAGSFAAYANKDESGWSGWASDDDAELMATTYHFENCVAFGNVNAKSNKSVFCGGFIGKKAGEGTLELLNCKKNQEQTVEGDSATVAVNTLADYVSADELESKIMYESDFAFDFDNIWFISSDVLHLRTVAKSYGAATLSENADLRLSTYRNGLRFSAEIENFKRDYCEEYGVIMASKSVLGEEELTFDFVGTYGSGMAYDADEDIDIFFHKDDETVTFTSVVYNLKPENYSSDIVARAYLKFTCDGKTVTVYGNAVEANVNEIATGIKNNASVYDALNVTQKNVLSGMLP